MNGGTSLRAEGLSNRRPAGIPALIVVFRKVCYPDAALPPHSRGL
jgi:hypothetical protein